MRRLYANPWIVALALALSVGGVVAFAAQLGALEPADLGASGEAVVAPPVVIKNVEWVRDFEPGHGFVLDGVVVTFHFTDDFVGRLGFYVALTGQAPLPVEYNEDKNLDKAAGSKTVIDASFESLNIPQEAVEDIHILVCDDADSAPAGECTAPSGP
ncbi:MAG: hypothetical protein WBD55_09950 [Dehalococcoidia bacterium]